MKNFLNKKIETFLSAILCLLGFASCSRKVELEQPSLRKDYGKIEDYESIDIYQNKTSDDSKKKGKKKSEQEVIRPSYRVLYGPPPVSFQKNEKVLNDDGKPVEPVDSLSGRK